MAAADLFAYQVLGPPVDAIRLLTLLPAQFSYDVYLSITHEELEDKKQKSNIDQPFSTDSITQAVISKVSLNNHLYSTMAPTFKEFLSAYPERPRGKKSVAFTDAPPEIHEIPFEYSSWQNGEQAEPPSAFEVDHAEMLKEQALAAATAEELADAKEQAVQEANMHLDPALTQNFSCSIKRKPLPVRPKLMRELRTTPDRRAEEPFTPPMLARANTTFDDFLPDHKLNTWQNVDDAARQRRLKHKVSLLAADTLLKAQHHVKKAVVQLRQ
ncbi:hypothetical protein N0V83_006306 [Neocucurbitaria cava]|uniref:Uncharacterized protein n=1 Tax=Neocucurbitaria cava TaxID=798079 RepID=A0A9W8Y7M9_9PLEO|nr:hypothetical protein N0V83_006306 [Neocucurbitaria cava]